jgi:hypothetical protein
MTDDLESLYGKYTDFVAGLHADLDRTAGRPVAPAYKTPLLSFGDFCRTWDEWGRTDGLQAVWRQRFEAGYTRAAAEFRVRLEAAIGGERRSSNMPTPRAAA